MIMAADLPLTFFVLFFFLNNGSTIADKKWKRIKLLFCSHQPSIDGYKIDAFHWQMYLSAVLPVHIMSFTSTATTTTLLVHFGS